MFRMITILRVTAALSLIFLTACPPRDFTKTANVHFISYGNDKFKQSRERIQQEAIDTGWFKEVKIFTPDNIGDEFVNAHDAFIKSHPRGGGYWIWKPYIIWQYLQTMNDGDFLVYLDSGSTINSAGKNRFNDYLAAVNNQKSGVLGFQLKYIEKCWNKSDLADHFKVLGNAAIMDSGQVMATIVIMQKNQQSLDLAKLWFDTAVMNNYHFVDDSPSNIANAQCFEEHRHDQSIFSILMKMRHGLLIDDEVDEVQYSNALPFRATRKRI